MSIHAEGSTGMAPRPAGSPAARAGAHAARKPRHLPPLKGMWLSSEFQPCVHAAAIDKLHLRIACAFLGDANFERRELTFGRLRAAVYWTCLPAFLAAEGYRMLGCIGFDTPFQKEVVPIRVSNLRLGPDSWLEVPCSAHVFAAGARGRVAIAFSSENDSGVSVEVLGRDGTQELLDRWKEYARRHHPLRGKVIQPSGETVETERAYGWDDLFLPAAVKAALRRLTDGRLHSDPTALAELGIRRRRGVLLYGPPGTGKTLIGKILARHLAATFLWTTPRHLATAAQICEVLELARLLAPAVLFLEDLDVLAEDRATCRHAVALGELMNQLDGGRGDHDILTIGTTNRLDVVETALRNRPGRFDRLIEIPPPDDASRLAFLARRFAGHDVRSEDLAWLSVRARGRTGAEIEELANSVLLRALERAGAQGDAVDAGGFRIERALLAAALGTAASRRRTGLGFGAARAAAAP
ncbi:MAG: ATP-binding protein [Planctomycetes bacterium]|nr:ATP-binding protein [Planctomycetota bacterium]